MSDIINIVKQGYFEKGVFKIDSQLDRDVYVKYNDVLSRLGGKWNKKAKGHVFDGDVKPYLDLYLATGELPDKNPLAFFYTPELVVDTIFAELNSRIGFSSLRYLEPSAGTGSIINRLLQEGSENITAVELDPYRFKILENKNMSGVRLINADFLTHQFDEKFDVITMNPPFSVEGNTTCYIDHIKKAYSLLTDNGILASVVPVGWLTSSVKKQTEFREWVYNNGYYFRLDEKSFKESGTLVGCAVVVIEKCTGRDYKELYETEYCGYLNKFIHNLCLNADCSERFYKNKLELHKKLEKGIDISEDIRHSYLEIVSEMRKNSEFIPVKEEWLNWLVEEFIKDYSTEY